MQHPVPAETVASAAGRNRTRSKMGLTRPHAIPMLAVVATIVSPVASIRCLSGQMDIGSDGAYTPTTIGGVDMSPISVDCDSHSTAAFEATAQDAVATAWADTALGGAITAIGNPYTLLSFTSEDDISFDL